VFRPKPRVLSHQTFREYINAFTAARESGFGLGGYPRERLIFSVGASLGGSGFGASPGGRGSDFFGGGPEYFKFSPFTWQDKELIPVLMAKPAECGNSREEKS
jgi:hypothetical protein